MRDSHSAPPVVVGIDGSQAALGAAVWAAEEAAARAIPLKLVSIIYRADLLGIDPGTDQLAEARAALSDAQHAVEAAIDKPVEVETEALKGNPLATLIELSRSAAMVCVGALGIEHACHAVGTTAAALAGSAGCPVAVIRPPDTAQRNGTGHIAAEVDASPEDNAVLEWALAEARLRAAPVRLISTGLSQAGQEQLNRRIDHAMLRYPDAAVELIAVPGGIAEYLAENAGAVQLLVSGTRDRRSLGQPGDTEGCSVLTVGGIHR